MTPRSRLMLCGLGFLVATVFAILLLEAPPDGVERGELGQFIGRFHPLAVHLQLSVDCGPCQKRICPLSHHRCMRDISAEQVLAITEAALADSSAA